MRPLPLVMEAMIKLVPENFEHRQILIEEFQKIQDSIRYTAPEAMSVRWDQTAEILTDCLDGPPEEWKNKIALVFSGKLDYQQILKN